jgi:asparagine synthase (glutamine-hydrolysing)
MCGIAGVYNLRGEAVPTGLLKRMTEVIAHRGPDGEGHYTDGPIGLGHRRLAVIDLSAAGRQPMANETGDVIVVYNGEVYNFQQLRTELEALGHRFHSATDSEVVVHAYEAWGESCVDHFNGMFAFALWDRPRQRLFLARDRYGVKPLYWYCRDGVFVFASEIKAILEHPKASRALCYPALNEYFTFQNILSDLTLFEGVRLLPPGCRMSVDARATEQPRWNRYWDYPHRAETWRGTADECAARLYVLFDQAVTRQLVSDVPVGAYLSGGMDSGSIVSVAARHLRRLRTFTGGFDLSSASGLELGFDERRNAELLANLFKSEHYEIVMHAGDMEWVLPRLVWHLEDLRVGQSYPNYYVAGLASKFVKVVLSGAGGDELFAGYPWRYHLGARRTSPDEYFRTFYRLWQRLVPDDHKPRLFNDDSRRQLGDHSAYDAFREVFGEWNEELQSSQQCVEASLYFELKTFLHGLLVVEDKLSMAHSLETRVPFLDNDLVDFALRIPATMKLRDLGSADRMDENVPGKRFIYDASGSAGKMILRTAMERLVPRDVTERIKQGFSAPDGSWFRGDSIDYINRLLRDRKAMIYEFLTPQYVKDILDDHCTGHANRRLLIWSLLCFEWWCRSFLGFRSGPSLN